ncbi:MAG: 50S ribosomal protein L6 [Candidatus Saccharibacteria bacterium]|nr:50S ribosomal protein L6 [Candidatus Saccharibacteria bacterium]MCY4010962.1 50S ribosomal protein L6 [Candidatus Saccharibacteria bacterium]MCY4089059.1 50S ribosomal protein L6 [Candidatus Saccharibacteria bacterium]
MSRIGQQPITIPDNVQIKLADQQVVVSGPKGQLNQTCLDQIDYDINQSQCLVIRKNDSSKAKAQHGLMRSLIANMVEGVSQGFNKELEIIGIGYKARLEGQTLILNIGFSHEVKYQIPDNVQITIEGNNIKLHSIDKQLIGQVAATIRNFKKPEPYKGKGIRYRGEKIRRKAGKGAKEN